MRRLVLLLMIVFSILNLTAQESFTGTIDHDGRERTFRLYLPSAYNEEGDPLPLVIALHPSGGGASGMARITGFDTIAEREGFIVMYPEGPFGYWDYGYGTPQWQYIDDALDDPGFLDRLIDATLENLNVDESRLYVAGYSNGARMALRLACDAADRISAVAAVSATISTEIIDACPEDSRVSIIYMHGREDEITPWTGKPLFINNMQISIARSAPETVTFWTTQNNCDEDTVEVDDTGEPRIQRFNDCDDGRQVAFYGFENGRHEWFARDDFNASEVIWQFFSQNPRSPEDAPESDSDSDD